MAGELVRVEGRCLNGRQDPSRRRLDRDDGALLSTKTEIRGPLGSRIDGGGHRPTDGLTPGDELLDPVDGENVGSSVQDPILGALQPGRSVDERVEAGDRRIQPGVGVLAQVGQRVTRLHRSRDRVGTDEDRSALAVVFGEKDALVTGTVPVVTGVDHLNQGDVDQDRHHEQREHQRQPAHLTTHAVLLTQPARLASSHRRGREPPVRVDANGRRSAARWRRSPSWRPATIRRMTGMVWSVPSTESGR